MTDQLVFREPGGSRKPNFLLYGPAKTGKTFGLASAPGPILYLNGDTPNASALAHSYYPDKLFEVTMTGLATMEAVAFEAEDKSMQPWGTVAVDTIDDLYRILVEEASGRSLAPRLDVYRDAQTQIERFCRKLCRLQDICVVIVCHDFFLKDEESGTLITIPFAGPKSNPALSNALSSMVDVLGYTAAVRPNDDAPLQYVAQLEPGNGRRAGDRFNVLGPHRPVDISAWVDEINAPFTPDQTTAQEATA